MQVSKRQFLKLGLRGAAFWVLAPLLKPASLFAGTLVTPPTYLNSAVHSYWMRLSYNQKRESQKVRRTVGAALRNIGAIKGRHGGFDFTLSFDRAVVAAFVRWAGTRQKPNSLFGLIGMLYNDFLYPELGPDGGRALFGILLGMLRGWDGTVRGSEVHQLYLTYRDLALRYKDAARTRDDPVLTEQLRQARRTALGNWRTAFLTLVEDYAAKRRQLDPQVVITNEMIGGYRVHVNPDLPGPTQLRVERAGGRVIVRWKGTGFLQQSDTLAGPWTSARKASPAAFEMNRPGLFIRTSSDNGSQP